MPINLTPEQAAAVYDRGGGLLVSAAAGSGKTRVLVERLLTRVTEENLDIDRFLVITYTKAAAAELRGRIVEELSRRLAENPTDSHLRRQQTLVYKAQISTVHSLCAQLLRESGHLLDLDPDFRLCDEGEAGLLMLKALDDVLERRYETIEENMDFALLVDTMSAGRDDKRLVDIVLDIRGRVQSHPDPAAWLAEQKKAFTLDGVTDAAATPWGALLLEDARRQATYWLGRLAKALELCDLDPNLSANYAPTISATMEGVQQLLKNIDRGWDAAVSALPVPFPRAGSKKMTEDPRAAEQVKSIRALCRKRLDKLAELLEDSSAGLLEDLIAVAPAVGALFALVNDFEQAYTAEKTRRGLLDFADLEHLAVKLLADPGTAARYAARYDEIMVDEYQDTNAVQNAIFSALSREEKNLFMVGDVKQSIYRFRLADPTIFLGKYKSFTPVEEAVEGENRRVILSQNFRSRAQVLLGANYVFENIMSTEFGEMAYGAEEKLYPGATYPAGDEDWYKVELDALDLSGSGDEDDEGEKTPRDLLEARFVADRIFGLLEEKIPISDGEGGTRPAKYADMVILLRSPGAVLHHYARALGERDIPWEADGGGDFFASTEVTVALSLLQIVDNPRQDVPLLSALRSPVYAFSADRLAMLRANSPGTDFYAALEKGANGGSADCAAFLAELADLRFGAGDKDSYELLWHIYDRANLLGVFGAMDEGETRQGNLLALTELARIFEGAGHKGLFGFLTHLTRLREKGDKLTAPRPGREGGGVRIMSIHRSKGLEFPIVFLTGLMRRLNRDDMQRPILFHPKLGVGPKRLDTEKMVEYPTLARRAVARQLEYEMMAEELRLLYVAMTRAREKLILSCALTRGADKLAVLAENADCPVDPQVLAGCSTVGEWVLLPTLVRPEAVELRAAAGAALIPPDVDYGPDWDIRWVDGSVYEVGRPTSAASEGAAEEEAGGGKPPPYVDHFAWVYPYSADVDIPSKLTATQLKGRQLDEEIAANAPSPGGRVMRAPAFSAAPLTPAQKGTALHLVMQYIDFARTNSVEEIQEEITRLVAKQFLTPQQGEAVDPQKIFNFFSSPLGQELRAAPTLRREFKFSILAPAGQYYPGAGEGEKVLLQGVVDCCYETPEGLTVVDFKTDRVKAESLPERAEYYRPQLTAYARALAEVMEIPVTKRLLWFFSADTAIEI